MSYVRKFPQTRTKNFVYPHVVVARTPVRSSAAAAAAGHSIAAAAAAANKPVSNINMLYTNNNKNNTRIYYIRVYSVSVLTIFTRFWRCRKEEKKMYTKKRVFPDYYSYRDDDIHSDVREQSLRLPLLVYRILR